MTARELESAVTILERKWLRSRDAAGGAAVCVILAAIVAPLWLAAGLVCLTGALVAAAIALANLISRREVIARLALDPHAHAIPAVREYGLRLVRPDEREKLAAWLYEVVHDGALPGNWYLADRVSRHAVQLELLASEFASSRLRVLPASAAACRYLLTHGADSPLYNPDIPVEDLSAAIQRIRRGITG